MKKKFNYILIFLFFTQLSFSQKIVDLKADYYNIEKGELFLYEKVGEVFNEISLYIEPDVNGIQKIIVEKQEILKNEIPKEVIRIEQLKTVSRKDILHSLKGKIFTENTYDKRELNTLELYNDFFFKISTFLLEKSQHSNKKNKVFWEFYDRVFTSYFFIRLNNEKIITVFIENIEVPNKWGFLIPFQNQLQIIWDKDYYFDLKNNNQISQDSLQILNNQILYFQNLNLPFKIKNNTLYDIALGQKLILKEFDKIDIIENNLIVGIKDSNLLVYDLKLKDITPKKLRAIFSPMYDVKYAQILVGNEIKWLDYNGKFLNTWNGGRYIYENEHSRKISKFILLIDTSKYKFIGQFTDNFARFELYNGKQGWLDFTGKEYYDYDSFAENKVFKLWSDYFTINAIKCRWEYEVKYTDETNENSKEPLVNLISQKLITWKTKELLLDLDLSKFIYIPPLSISELEYNKYPDSSIDNLKDVNSDNYTDIQFMTEHAGAGANIAYTTYLFNSKNNKFEYSELFSGYNIQYDSLKNRISSVSRGGWKDLYYIFKNLKENKNEIEFVEKIRHYIDTIYYQKLINEKIIVKKKIVLGEYENWQKYLERE